MTQEQKGFLKVVEDEINIIKAITHTDPKFDSEKIQKAIELLEEIKELQTKDFAKGRLLLTISNLF